MEKIIFERPPMTTLPSKESIASLQANVQYTKMGKDKKHDNLKINETSGQHLPSKWPAHCLISIFKYKWAIFLRIPKIICNFYFTHTMIEKREEVISYYNCDHDLFVK